MKPTILIIEDNKQNMYMLSYLLTNNDYEVYKAFNGHDGLQLALTHLPQIILIDIQLPDMDGYEICLQLRGKKVLRYSTIIAVTSYALGGDKEKAIQAGANGYIEKPINPDTFIKDMNTIYNINNSK